MTKLKIFITHSPKDKAWVRSFARALEGQGAAVWLDEWELRAGDDWREALERGLRASDVLACVVTPESAQQPTLWFEVGAAVGMGKRVIPIVPEDFDASALPYSLRVRRVLQRTSPEETARRLLAETAAAVVT
jgi:hypothetical protein